MTLGLARKISEYSCYLTINNALIATATREMTVWYSTLNSVRFFSPNIASNVYYQNHPLIKVINDPKSFCSPILQLIYMKTM